MAKKMKANDIVNSAKREYSSTKITVVSVDGEEYEVEIQEKLNDSKVSQLVYDLVNRSEFCDKNNIEFNIVNNIYFLLIKYFTNIKFVNSKDLKKQYSNELAFIDGLLDLDLFEQIVSHFDKDSLYRVQNMFEKYSKTLSPVINNEIKNMLKGDEDAII